LSKFFVGDDITTFEDNGKQLPISRVTLKVDDENVLTTGNDTGVELIADCPHATQAMVNAILAQVKGYRYQMFSAGDTGLDPSAELGDGITAGGVYSVISRISDDGSGYPSITAPGKTELEDEYPAAGPMSREFDRKIAETRSSITKTAEQIRLEVENEIRGLSASITVELGKITQEIEDAEKGLNSKIEQTASSLTSKITATDGRVSSLSQSLDGFKVQMTGPDGQVSTLQQTAISLQSQITSTNGSVSTISQKVDNITISVTNEKYSSYISIMSDGVQIGTKEQIKFTGDVVFESDLRDGKTTISGDCIATGSISARRIELGEKMTVYENLENRWVGGYFGSFKSYDFDGNETTGVIIQDAGTDNMVVVTTGGARMTSPTAEMVVATNATIQTSRAINLYSNGFNSDQDLNITSDQRQKEDIRYDVTEKYMPIFDRLKPCSFLRKDKGPQRHLGFIAQEYLQAQSDAGVAADDSVIFQNNNGTYGLTYSEFIPMLVAKIQELNTKVKELEAWKS